MGKEVQDAPRAYQIVVMSDGLQDALRAYFFMPQTPAGLPTFDAYERRFHSAEILKQVQDDGLTFGISSGSLTLR